MLAQRGAQERSPGRPRRRHARGPKSKRRPTARRGASDSDTATRGGGLRVSVTRGRRPGVCARRRARSGDARACSRCSSSKRRRRLRRPPSLEVPFACDHSTSREGQALAQCTSQVPLRPESEAASPFRHFRSRGARPARQGGGVFQRFFLITIKREVGLLRNAHRLRVPRPAPAATPSP